MMNFYLRLSDVTSMLLTTGLLPTLCGLKLGLLVAGVKGLIVDSF